MRVLLGSGDNARFMPVRIADIELWSSSFMGRCWHDGLNKRLVGPWLTSRSSPRTSIENIPSGDPLALSPVE
jgi:hypothetical protein